jgi:hypothetical protein
LRIIWGTAISGPFPLRIQFFFRAVGLFVVDATADSAANFCQTKIGHQSIFHLAAEAIAGLFDNVAKQRIVEAVGLGSDSTRIGCFRHMFDCRGFLGQ